jgi:hypothetical protein
VHPVLSFTSHSLKFGGSLMIFHLLRWLCKTSWPVASRNCEVAVLLDQLLSGPFLFSSHQLLFSDYFFLSLLKIFFSVDLILFLTVLKVSLLVGGGGFLVAALARKSAFLFPKLLQWLGIHCRRSSLFRCRDVESEFLKSIALLDGVLLLR